MPRRSGTAGSNSASIWLPTLWSSRNGTPEGPKTFRFSYRGRSGSRFGNRSSEPDGGLSKPPTIMFCASTTLVRQFGKAAEQQGARLVTASTKDLLSKMSEVLGL